MNKTKKLIEEAILFAIDAISKDIQTEMETDDNWTRSQTIKMLAEAYNIVHRGKNND